MSVQSILVVISQQVSAFIFKYIDSVEQLEILLLLSSDPAKLWSAAAISQHLRSNITSVEKRLQRLCGESLLICTPERQYQFAPSDADMTAIVADVASVYKSHRHRLLELIFSPSKKARDFSDAFRVTGKKGDDNG